MKNILFAFLLFAASANADPYLTAGVGGSNTGQSFATIGVGYKVDDHFSLEADYRDFGAQSQYGAIKPTRLQTQIFDPSTNTYYYPASIDQDSLSVKTRGAALSAIFTSGDPDVFVFGRTGLMFRSDKISQRIGSYVDATQVYHSATTSAFTEKSIKPIFGAGFYLYGASIEATYYGNTAKQVNSVNGSLLTYQMSYRINF